MLHLQIVTLTATLALTSVATFPAFAWGPEDHAIVADIAETHLTPAAAAQVAQLLKLDGHAHVDEVSSWADDIRSQRKETAPWHFVDIPLSASTYDPDRDCAGGNCVIAKIVEFTGVLRDPSTDPQARVEALKWVVHFVGDVHQTLHAEDGSDRGGNDVRISYFGKRTNLHAIWDGGVIEQATGLKLGPNFTFDHQAVSRVAHSLDASISGDHRQEWAAPGLLNNLQPVVVAWAMEAHGDAQTVAYADLAADRTGDWYQDYQAQAWPVVQIQLERAGVRLAEVLNEALP